MSKKIKITESQLKMLMERKHFYQQANEEKFDEIEQLKDDDKQKIDVEVTEDSPVVTESIKKIKSDFKRFLQN